MYILDEMNSFEILSTQTLLNKIFIGLYVFSIKQTC